MRILILHNRVAADADAADRDVLVQRDAVAAALQQLGHETTAFGCTLNLQELAEELDRVAPDAVFNLLESLGGTDRLMPLAALVLEAVGMPYTGASSRSMSDTIGKLTTKRRLRAAGLPTAWWYSSEDPLNQTSDFRPEIQVIFKPVWEHASAGMDDASVMTVTDSEQLSREIRDRERRSGRPHFAEQYIAGREFNLSLLGQPSDAAANCLPRVLPPAEIDFSSYPQGKPRIVGHAAKWDESSFEYRETPRRFEFPESDRSLLSHLQSLAVDCWQLFELSGYARVDFRVDHDGRPWILEVNVNPCLSPDAGFAAALQQAQIPWEQAVDDILQQAFSRGWC